MKPMITTPTYQRSARPLTALLIFLTAACSYGASFGGLGILPGSDLGSAAYDVSADGSVVVGWSRSSSGGEAFRWTQQSGIVGLGYLPGFRFTSFARSVSGDGLTIVGCCSSVGGAAGEEAFQWTRTTGMTSLGDLGGGPFQCNACGSSFDGSIIVGLGTTTAGSGELGTRAVRWLSGGPPVAIGDIDGAYATTVSGDGLTIAGFEPSQPWHEAFRWTLATGMVGLGNSPDGVLKSYTANGISTDGSVIVGQGFHTDNGSSEAFSWTQATGLAGLGHMTGGSYSYAWDVSADGTYIVGADQVGNSSAAFIWDSAHGMRNLRDVLISDYGVTNLKGWTLSAARGISADGQTIVGDGINPSGQMEAWRVTGVRPLAIIIGTSPNGSVTANASHYVFNTTAILTAEPKAGYVFTGWTGDATGIVNPLSIHMDSDKTISATFSIDSDDDGISDNDELTIYHTNPNLADSDNDGLSDHEEIFTYRTNPNIADTDGDGIFDGYEVLTGHSPLNALDAPPLVAEARTAIEFTFPASIGKSYRIEDSSDMTTWSTVESGIAGNGAIVQRFYSTRNVAKRYFRVADESAP